MNRILIVVLVLVLAIGGYALWSRSHPGSSFGDGSVKSTDGTSTDKAMNSGATTELDGKESIDSVKPMPSRSDAPGTINGEPVSPGASTNQAPAGQSAPNSPITGAPLPRRDTISPNPPNGAVFTASGKYQWYRQGNLTWRVDSGSGNSCIAFATMEEWQKPIVYSNGCRSNS